MIKIGQFNTLTVLKEVPFGIYLDGKNFGEILLPKQVVPKGTRLHDALDVFIYFDSEDKIIATTLQPLAQLDECAFLKAVDVNHVGAFLNWGLDKDLLVPRPEQFRPMEKDKFYIVYVKQDHQGRLLASSRLDNFLDKTIAQLKPGDAVNLMIAATTDLGHKVIINHRHWGLIHRGDVFQTLSLGQKVQGYVKTIRPDGKIDVVLKQPGQNNIRELAQSILKELQQQGGFLPLHDKSPALHIQQTFNQSKKSFKSAIGQLYKQGEIDIATDGIRLRGK